MYSAVVLGWPATDHQPEPRDVDTDRDHVRRQHDVDRGTARPFAGFAPVNAHAELVEDGGDVAGADPRGELLGLIEIPVGQPSSLRTPEAVGHVVVEHPAHAAQLAQRVEVADQRHPRVGSCAVLLVEHLLPRPARVAYTRVATDLNRCPMPHTPRYRRPGVSSIGRSTAKKESPASRTCGGNTASATAEQRCRSGARPDGSSRSRRRPWAATACRRPPTTRARRWRSRRGRTASRAARRSGAARPG